MGHDFDEDHAMSQVLDNIFKDEDVRVPAVPKGEVYQVEDKPQAGETNP